MAPGRPADKYAGCYFVAATGRSVHPPTRPQMTIEDPRKRGPGCLSFVPVRRLHTSLCAAARRGPRAAWVWAAGSGAEPWRGACMCPPADAPSSLQTSQPPALCPDYPGMRLGTGLWCISGKGSHMSPTFREFTACFRVDRRASLPERGAVATKISS